jgi:nicotinamide phosphoribosyltransferase
MIQPPELYTDSYKQFHHLMYPEGMTLLFSNMTPRSYKRLGNTHAVWFGLQRHIKEMLIDQWNKHFFAQPIEVIKKRYKRFHKGFSGIEDIDTTHLEKLHALGFLPLEIRALPEGVRVPARVPFYTIHNTVKGFGWLVNYLETPMSTGIWDLTTIATIGDMYRKVLNEWALKTTGSIAGVEWQGHDFSQRGRTSAETTENQLGWLLSFNGTDTIPAVLAAEYYYNADMDKELIGASVPATEHSVMTSYGKEEEIEAFKRLLEQFPKGILSVVSDSFDLWQVLTKFMPELKEQILARDGKLVIRPDSGDPVDIICGTAFKKEVYDEFNPNGEIVLKAKYTPIEANTPEEKGVIELLWDEFGGTINNKGYKVLDPHVGAIYGDSITLDRANEICARLEAKGFASTNIVLGVGSYTMNYNTRDTLGIAVKSTYCEVETRKLSGISVEEREIFKDPITDDGTKKSAKGLIAVHLEDGEYVLKDQVSWDDVRSEKNQLVPVFRNSQLLVDHTLADIRKRLNP